MNKYCAIILTVLFFAAGCSPDEKTQDSGTLPAASNIDPAAQELYEKARSAFRNDGMRDLTLPEYGGKKEPAPEELLTLLYEKYAGSAVDFNEGNYKEITFTAGPAALDMLGLLYLNRGDNEKAMYYFTEMYEKYPDEIFVSTGPAGKSPYYGIAGAAAILRQADIYAGRISSGDNQADADYNKAMRLYYTAFNKYGSSSFVGYKRPLEGIKMCLEKSEKPMKEVEQRISGLIRQTGQEWIKAENLYYLAKRYYAEGDRDNALRICDEILKDHRLSYYNNEHEMGFKAYSLYAAGMKMKIMKEKGRPVQEILEVKNEAKKIYEDFLYDVIHDKKHLEKPLEKIYEVHVEKVQKGYVKGYGDTMGKTGGNTGY